MKAAVSELHKALVAGSGVVGQWSIYARTVSTLSTALGSGTWTNLTSRTVGIPDINTAIEYEVGQFSSDQISLTLTDLPFIKSDIFPSSTLTDATKYIEFKLEWQVQNGSVVSMFYGFADKESIEYQIDKGIVRVQIMTPQDIGQRIAAENLTTQYKVPKIDGTNDGLRLMMIPGLYVIDAAVTSYVLQVGVHDIEYENGKARLDSGDWVNVPGTASAFTLASSDELEKITLYKAASVAVHPDDSIKESIIVRTAGDKLPYQWYTNHGLRGVINSAMSNLGISNVTYETLEMPSHDGAETASVLDYPPNDVSVVGDRGPITVDNAGDIWLTIGNKLYKRTTSTEVYTLKATLNTGDKVRRMWYNYRSGDHDDIWMYVENGSDTVIVLYENTANQTRRYTIATAADRVAFTSCHVLDYNYTGTSYRYYFCYTVNPTPAGGGAFLDNGFFRTLTKGTGTTLTMTTVWSDTKEVIGSIQANFMYQKSAGTLRYVEEYSTAGYGYGESTINTSGNWVQNARVFASTSFDGYLDGLAAYHPTSDRVYFYAGSATGKVISHPAGSYSETDHHTLVGDPTEDFGGELIYANGAVYYTTISNSRVYILNISEYDDRNVWKVSGTTASVRVSGGIYTDPNGGFQMAYNSTNGRLYAIGDSGMLHQLGSTVAMFARYADFTDQTITEAFNIIMKTYNLVGTITAEKKGYVFRRAGNTGTLNGTGTTLTVGLNQIESIREKVSAYPKIDLVTIKGYSKSTNYNGTAFDVIPAGDAKEIEVDSPLIPDTLIKHLAKHIYTCFSTTRNVYEVEVAVPYYEYEVFDNLSFNITAGSDAVSLNKNGVIISMKYGANGSVEFEMVA